MTEAEKVQRGAMSKTTPKAQHDCKCDWCHDTIQRGHVHVKYVYGTHTERHSKRYHPECWEEMNHD